ncbi:MAG TPA: hypothetical protein VD707_08090 [Gemmatimonadales bacterium]|nr:hypothetical protein [Gemmatimonadales bacterium]
MRRMFVLTMALAAAAAAPAAAQLLAGMPAWNSPKGGTGLTLSADYGLPNDDAGGGDAYGVRGSFGFSKFTIAAGYSGYEADGATERLSSWGAGAAFQLLGGALNPINVNIVGGVGTTGNIPTTVGEVDLTTYYAGAGASVNLPVPGFAIEPYLSVTNRWNAVSGADTQSDLGWTLGANVGLGMFGLHVAYDSQDYGGTTGSIIAFGAHIGFGVPGM